jgi:hypothetical protein
MVDVDQMGLFFKRRIMSEVNDYNYPVAMHINGNLKFEFYIDGETYVTDLLRQRKYHLIPDDSGHLPFRIELSEKK